MQQRMRMLAEPLLILALALSPSIEIFFVGYGGIEFWCFWLFFCFACGCLLLLVRVGVLAGRLIFARSSSACLGVLGRAIVLVLIIAYTLITSASVQDMGQELGYGLRGAKRFALYC